MLTVVSVANRGLVERCALTVGLMVVIALFGLTGCSESPDQGGNDSSRKHNDAAGKDESEKPKTVVVNKGMSKKEEKKLNKRLNELEKEVEAQEEKSSGATASSTAEASQPEPAEQQVEAQVRMAADAYYQAVEDEDWGYTYDHLDSETQSGFTRDEWFAKNEWGANTSPATFTVQYVEMDDSSPHTLANVTVLLALEDGSTSIRNTYFVYEDGLWKHSFSAQEYEILANAGSATASASSSVSGDPSASGSNSVSDGPVPPISEDECPQSAPIKGNQSGLYHVPGGAYYDETNPEECFATAADAEAAGYEASSR